MLAVVRLRHTRAKSPPHFSVYGGAVSSSSSCDFNLLLQFVLVYRRQQRCFPVSLASQITAMQKFGEIKGYVFTSHVAQSQDLL